MPKCREGDGVLWRGTQASSDRRRRGHDGADDVNYSSQRSRVIGIEGRSRLEIAMEMQ